MTTLWDELYPDYALAVFLEEVKAKIPSLQQTYAIDTTDEAYGEPFLFYLLFTHWPSLLDLTPAQAFYNRYYWFRYFMDAYQAKMGANPGLEQQQFQMLEQAPNDLDWEMIPLIEARAKPRGPSKPHPEVFWINATTKGQLGIMPRPRGGDWLDGEIQSLAKAGVNVVVSLLTADEVAELELQDEERLCGDCGIRFISFPIPDRSVPFSIPEAGCDVDLILEESAGRESGGRPLPHGNRAICPGRRLPAQIPRHRRGRGVCDDLAGEGLFRSRYRGTEGMGEGLRGVWESS